MHIDWAFIERIRKLKNTQKQYFALSINHLLNPINFGTHLVKLVSAGNDVCLKNFRPSWANTATPQIPGPVAPSNLRRFVFWWSLGGNL